MHSEPTSGVNICGIFVRISEVMQARPFPGAGMAAHTLRVVVVDDNASVRRSICRILRSEADIEIVSEAIDGADAVRRVGEHQPDVVLLDITMPTMNGLEVAEIIKREFPAVHVLMVSQHDSRGFRWAALAAGVSGYVIKSNVGKDLIPELRRIQLSGISRLSSGPSGPDEGGS